MDNQGTKKFRIAPPMIAIIGLVLTWQLAGRIFHVNELILPTPWQVALAMRTHARVLASNAAVTTVEAITGFVSAAVLAMILASAAVFSRWLGEVIMPLAVAVKATPVIVLAPLLVMWLGNGYLSKAAMAMVASFFPILVNAYLGLTAVDSEWVSLMRLHKASNWKIFTRLRLPHALPEIFAGLQIATSLAMVGAVVAEFTGAEDGLGKLIATSTFYLNIDLVFAGVLVLCVIGVLFYGLMVLLRRSVVFWRAHQ